MIEPFFLETYFFMFSYVVVLYFTAKASINILFSFKPVLRVFYTTLSWTKNTSNKFSLAYYLSNAQ